MNLRESKRHKEKSAGEKPLRKMKGAVAMSPTPTRNKQEEEKRNKKGFLMLAGLTQ